MLYWNFSILFHCRFTRLWLSCTCAKQR